MDGCPLARDYPSVSTPRYLALHTLRQIAARELCPVWASPANSYFEVLGKTLG